MKPFKELHYLAGECVRCGACKAVCPIFSVLQREIASPRGKVSLCQSLERGDIDLTPKLISAIRECLTCAACRENCPNSVDLPSMILALRAKIFKEKGLPFYHLLLSRMFASRLGSSLAFKGVSMFQGLLFKELPECSGLHARLPLPFIDRERLIPPLTGKTFLERRGSKDERRKVKYESKDKMRKFNRQSSIVNRQSLRVGLFAGCLVNYMMPEIGRAALRVLEKAGVQVVIPIEQVCCGIPALSMGDTQAAKGLAIRNLEIFNRLDLDFIVTPCPTCATALKLHIRELLKEEKWEVKKMAEDFASKAREITEFLVREIQDPTLNQVQGKIQNKTEKVTYHDPCHMSRYLKLKDEPRKLIEWAGYGFVELAHPCRCCGFGGVFSIDNYALSKEIGKDKALDIAGSEAYIVATTCPGCIIQLKDALHRLEVKKKVLHVVELLAN